MERFAITPGLLVSGGDGSDLERLAKRCAELGLEGVDFILLREKHLTPRELYLAARALLEACAGGSVKLLIGGPTQVALASNAAGVHVGTDYARVRTVKREFTESWVSVSCHSLAEVAAAKSARADLCLFGPVFGKTVSGAQVLPGLGVEALREACNLAGKNLPVYALGGVTAENAASCMEAGAAGIAGIRLYFDDAPVEASPQGALAG